MPIDDLTALGQKMREARKKKDLTQQELADLSHVSVKEIANIEKGKMNPSYLILRALAKVLHISLDTLINPDVSLEDEGVNQMKMFYSSCPPEMRDTLLHHTQETVKELTELSGCGFPKLIVRLPCGSPSIRSTFFPACARPIPKFAQVVVLPTPPFWLAMTMICVFMTSPHF